MPAKATASDSENSPKTPVEASAPSPKTPQDPSAPDSPEVAQLRQIFQQKLEQRTKELLETKEAAITERDSRHEAEISELKLS
jgi:hypothetical protein